MIEIYKQFIDVVPGMRRKDELRCAIVYTRIYTWRYFTAYAHWVRVVKFWAISAKIKAVRVKILLLVFIGTYVSWNCTKVIGSLKHKFRRMYFPHSCVTEWLVHMHFFEIFVGNQLCQHVTYSSVRCTFLWVTFL